MSLSRGRDSVMTRSVLNQDQINPENLNPSLKSHCGLENIVLFLTIMLDQKQRRFKMLEQTTSVYGELSGGLIWLILIKISLF